MSRPFYSTNETRIGSSGASTIVNTGQTISEWNEESLSSTSTSIALRRDDTSCRLPHSEVKTSARSSVGVVYLQYASGEHEKKHDEHEH